ncbi:MAG: PAS domain S-box protein [Promethearchaeota archaeon]
MESNIFSLSEYQELKTLLKNPEDDLQQIISLLEKKVQERTRLISESEEKYRSLITVLTNIGFGIDIISNNHEIIYQNQVLKENFGDCIGKICYESYMSNQSKCNLCQMEETLEYNEIKKNELKAANDKLYEIISAPYPNSDGTLDKVLEIIIDITEKKKVEQKLRESEEKYRILTEQSLFGIFIIQNGIFKYINQGVSDITGYSVDEMLQWTGLDIAKIIFSEDLENIMTRLKRSENGDLDEQSSSIFRLVTKSGEIKWVEEYNKRIRFQGKLASMVTLVDITSRIQSEQKLIESENKYRHLFYNLPIGISIFNSKGNLVESNNVILKRLSEYAELDFTGKNYLEIIPYFQNTEQLIKLFSERFEMVRKGKNPGPVELYINTNQGQRIWLYWNSSRIEINNEMFIQVIMQDITEQKEAEEKLRESEEKFRNISEQSLIGIGILQDNVVKYGNKKFADIFGYTVEDMLGWSPEEFMKTVYPDDREFVFDQVKKKQGGSEKYLENYQFRGIKKSREIIWIENFTKTIMFEGRPADFVAFIDITERKNAQQELIKLNQLKSELLRRTSHELKTPLVSIKGFSDLLLQVHRDKLDAMVISTLNEIKQGCLRLETLIADILKTAELESGAIKLNKAEEDLTFLVNVCVNEIKGFSKMRNHTINLKVQENLITQFEKEQIHQVISNLLTNAVKYTPPGGLIEIKSEIYDNFIVLSIKDNGIGFTEEEKFRIFKQFGKIERYGQGLDIITEGSGFGLFISKKIIELHDGNIWMESEGRNKGSTFYFSLPLIQN